MNNIRQFKKPPPPVDAAILCCPECDCQDVTIWELNRQIIITCAECEIPIDMSEYLIEKPIDMPPKAS